MSLHYALFCSTKHFQSLPYISFILTFFLCLKISWNSIQTNPEIKDPAGLTILHRRMCSLPAFPFFPETPGKPLAPLSPE